MLTQGIYLIDHSRLGLLKSLLHKKAISVRAKAYERASVLFCEWFFFHKTNVLITV